MLRLWRRGTADEPTPSTAEQRTLALGAALEALAERDAPRILDFGSARGENVSFFSSLGAQMEILDLYARLNERHFESQAIRDVVGTLDRGAGPYDLILAWDVLDYLDRAQMEELFANLESLRSEGTRLLAFLSYSKEMPMHPRGFRIESRERLTFDPPASQRPCPRYQEANVLKVVPNLDVEASFLMRHGAREYVFRQAAG
ncbi:MAG: methyltransferase domain-containing protein [Acidobacteriota bacterium]